MEDSGFPGNLDFLGALPDSSYPSYAERLVRVEKMTGTDKPLDPELLDIAAPGDGSDHGGCSLQRNETHDDVHNLRPFSR